MTNIVIPFDSTKGHSNIFVSKMSVFLPLIEIECNQKPLRIILATISFIAIYVAKMLIFMTMRKLPKCTIMFLSGSRIETLIA